MKVNNFPIIALIIAFLIVASGISSSIYAQEDENGDVPLLDEPLEEEMLREEEEEEEFEVAEPEPMPDEPLPFEEEPIEAGEPGEGENRYSINGSGMVIANYVFNDSTDTFTVKYRWEIKGKANAATAVIRGDVTIDAEVDGALSKWPTGECKLIINIPKVPFELTFNKTDEEKGNLRMVFKRAIQENWASKCSFQDAPGANFDTTGPPEKWLTRALEKARPPLKSVALDMTEDVSTTQLLINKQIIDDPPLGSMEIEGTAVFTVTRGEGV